MNQKMKKFLANLKNKSNLFLSSKFYDIQGKGLVVSSKHHYEYPINDKDLHKYTAKESISSNGQIFDFLDKFKLKKVFGINDNIENGGFYPIGNQINLCISRFFDASKLYITKDGMKIDITHYDYHEQVSNFGEDVVDNTKSFEKEKFLQIVDFDMVYCDCGVFDMGSDEIIKNENPLLKLGIEKMKPKHEVRLTRDFWIGKTEVSRQLYRFIMELVVDEIVEKEGNTEFDENVEFGKGVIYNDKDIAMSNISYYDAIVFCNKLSEVFGLEKCYILSDVERIRKSSIGIKYANVRFNTNANGFRLPTIAEWEYAAKANQDCIFSGSNKLDEISNYWIENGKLSAIQTNIRNRMVNLESHACQYEMMTKKPNAWGIYDMTGNVAEWCFDDRNDDVSYEDRLDGITINPIIENEKREADLVGAMLKALLSGSPSGSGRGTMGTDALNNQASIKGGFLGDENKIQKEDHLVKLRIAYTDYGTKHFLKDATGIRIVKNF